MKNGNGFSFAEAIESSLELKRPGIISDVDKKLKQEIKEIRDGKQAEINHRLYKKRIELIKDLIRENKDLFPRAFGYRPSFPNIHFWCLPIVSSDDKYIKGRQMVASVIYLGEALLETYASSGAEKIHLYFNDKINGEFAFAPKGQKNTFKKIYTESELGSADGYIRGIVAKKISDVLEKKGRKILLPKDYFLCKWRVLHDDSPEWQDVEFIIKDDKSKKEGIVSVLQRELTFFSEEYSTISKVSDLFNLNNGKELFGGKTLTKKEFLKL